MASSKERMAQAEVGRVKQRLEYLRGELRAERISYEELHELQGLAVYIESGDVELLEAAGVPEFPSKLEALQMAVSKAITHIVDHGKIELGTPESRALIQALEESKK